MFLMIGFAIGAILSFRVTWKETRKLKRRDEPGAAEHNFHQTMRGSWIVQYKTLILVGGLSFVGHGIDLLFGTTIDKILD